MLTQQSHGATSDEPHPRWWTIGFAIGIPAGLVAIAVLVTRALREEQILISLAIFAFATVFIIVPEAWLLSHIGREIQTSDAEIRSKPYLGRAVALRWSEVACAERFVTFSLVGNFPTVYRLCSSDGRSVAFTSHIGAFDELIATIESRTRALREVRDPPWWRKVIFRGFH
jgi:hypothetical protein